MADRLIELPLRGNGYKGSVATASDLPASAQEGDVAFVIDEQKFYYFDGSSWQPSASGGVTDHGMLTGLGDDDHLQYLRTDGTRALSGDWNAGAHSITADDLIANNSVTADVLTATSDITSPAATIDTLSSDSVTTDNLTVNINATVSGQTETDTLLVDTSATIQALTVTTSIGADSLNVSTSSSLGAATTTTLSSTDITADSIELADGIVGDTTGVLPSPGFVSETIVSEDTSFGTTGVAASGSWGAAHSLSLGAGIWLVSGTVGFDDNGAVLTTALEGALSNSATGVGITSNFTTRISAVYQGEDLYHPVPPMVFALSGTTTVYLNTKFYYTSGTPQHKGQITAIRIR